MSQVTGKKVATTPMPTPTGTSGAIIDSFNTQDDKTVNAPSIHIVEDAINAISETYTNLYTSSTEVSETTVEINSHVDDYKFILVCQKFALGFRNVS